MKRTKVLALVLSAAVMLMGAGYAAWSDQVFVTSTVRTGNFNMEVTKATTRTGDEQAKNEVHNWHSYDWTHSASVEHKANEVIVEFNDLYPGGMVQLDMTTVNNGTLPARLKGAKVEFVSGNEELFNLLRAQTSWKADIDGDGDQDDWSHVEDWKTWRELQGALNALVADTTADNLVIEPKGWFSLGDGTEEGCIKLKLDSSAGNEFQNKSVKFKITFDWEQWATNPNDNPYDGENGYGGDGDLQVDAE
ncbi:hypothetical protein [Anaerosolibacter sp.]|uniref:hypothetical protein n=1 Tax=Anaerosolibacter sp. TaxID=1872527 RepID=UPI0039F0EE9C